MSRALTGHPTRPPRSLKRTNGSAQTEVERLLKEDHLTAAADCALRRDYNTTAREISAVVRRMADANVHLHLNRIQRLIERASMAQAGKSPLMNPQERKRLREYASPTKPRQTTTVDVSARTFV